MEINNIHSAESASIASLTNCGVTYGYIRVSTALQHEDRQRMAMVNFGISEDCLFTDKQSGKDFDRPAYNAMMARLKSGDTVGDGAGGDCHERAARQADAMRHDGTHGGKNQTAAGTGGTCRDDGKVYPRERPHCSEPGGVSAQLRRTGSAIRCR